MNTTTAQSVTVDTEDIASTLLLTVGEVAAHLRCTRRSVERQIARQQLHVVRIGRSVRVERRELARYLSSLRESNDW